MSNLLYAYFAGPGLYAGINVKGDDLLFVKLDEETEAINKDTYGVQDMTVIVPPSLVDLHAEDDEYYQKWKQPVHTASKLLKTMLPLYIKYIESSMDRADGKRPVVESICTRCVVTIESADTYNLILTFGVKIWDTPEKYEAFPNNPTWTTEMDFDDIIAV